MKKYLKIITVIFLLVAIVFPIASNGQLTNLVPCDGVEGETCNFQALVQLIYNIINFAIVLALVFTAVAFAWAGILYLTAGGDSGKINRAHGIFKTVLIGFIFTVSAFLIIEVIAKGLGVPETIWQKVNSIF